MPEPVLPPPLPEPLRSVVVPDRFSPSTFAFLERCPLSVFAPTEANVLAPPPKALFGTLLHQVRHDVLMGRWGEATSAAEAVDRLLAAAVDALEAQLLEDRSTSRMVPLRQAVGRRRWTDQLGCLRRWARNRTSQRAEDGSRQAAPSSGEKPGTGRLQSKSSGSEQDLDCPGLRVRGRPDWWRPLPDGRIEVVDFKSGRVVGPDGEVLERHRVQMQLYALMLESRFPDAEVLPSIEREERFAVSWGDAERSAITERLEQARQSYPAGETLQATSLARPGSHCAACLLRPRCTRYLEEVPRWWPDRPGVPRPLPLDVWGAISAMNLPDEGCTIWLEDAAGRRVRVDGVRRDWGVEHFAPGCRVWFFELESSEDRRQHGMVVQPRNFHVQAPGARWAEAVRCWISRER